MPFSNNELAENAKGGTELMKEGLIRNVDPSLLEKVLITQSRIRNLADDMPNIFWAHDLPNDPESQILKDQKILSKIDKFIFVSNWQMQAYNWFLGIPYDKSEVIPNSIESFDHDLIMNIKREKINSKEIKLIYHTTPHRGLDILVPVFINLVNVFKENYPEYTLTLDVYSSFKIYGWEQRDEPFKALFQKCIDHPNINYHGTVSNEEIRKVLPHFDVFAYPCIWPETSCIAVIEALSAGCSVVCPNYAALPETTANFADMYQWSEDINRHGNKFMSVLASHIENIIMSRNTIFQYNLDAALQNVENQIGYFRDNYYWGLGAYHWEQVLKEVISNYSKRKNFLTFNTESRTIV